MEKIVHVKTWTGSATVIPPSLLTETAEIVNRESDVLVEIMIFLLPLCLWEHKNEVHWKCLRAGLKVSL